MAVKLTGKRSLASKLRNAADMYETDAERLNSTPHWIIRDRLKELADTSRKLAAQIDRMVGRA